MVYKQKSSFYFWTNSLIELCFSFLDTEVYQMSYSSCLNALLNGIHPEPGLPVQILLTTNQVTNCSIENINAGTKSCPKGWYVLAISAHTKPCAFVELALNIKISIVQ